MRRLFLPLLAALVALPLIASTTLAAHAHAEIALPNGWQPEGIAAGRGAIAYVGSLADGGVARVNLRTGDVDPDFIESATGPAVGLEYEKRADRLWVAGGPSGEVRVYDGSSGDLLETYAFDAGFVNDLVATRWAIYATDSVMQQLLVIPLGPAGSLPDPSAAFTRLITGDLVYESGFNANGIEAKRGWLIVAQSNTGELFAINAFTGQSFEILPAGSINAADGILLVGRTLYVVQNALNQVSVWRIGPSGGNLVEIITDADVPGDLDFPTTGAKKRGSLWLVNARFSTPATPDTEYWITRVPIH